MKEPEQKGGPKQQSDSTFNKPSPGCTKAHGLVQANSNAELAG
jgi:hypothetical protein